MKRNELEHIIRAAGAVADEDELIIIGSQAIRQGMAKQERLMKRLEATELHAELKKTVQSRITRDFLT